MHSKYNKIVSLATDGKYNDIKDVRHELFVEKMQMDKFFSKYLNKLGGKMDPDSPNTPIWKLYRAKMAEYGELERTIRAANHYIKKSHV
jgi:hypothetical protein